MHIYMVYTTYTRAQFKATKEIAAGQELFIRYGSATWFQSKGIPRVDVYYANTMWRPDLHRLPCRQNVAQTTGVDGQHSYAVVEAVSLGTVIEISLCLEVAVRVVDQFPFLWDFVLTGETKMSILTANTLLPALSRTRIVCIFADQGEGNIRERAERVSFFISALTLFQYPHLESIQSPLYFITWG